MIKVDSSIPQPIDFDEKCRLPGEEWIRKSLKPDTKRPPDFWSPFRPHLRDGFKGRCGYLAMHLPIGTVDHFVSWNSCRATNPNRAYEWNNYRFIAGPLNSSKKTRDDELLDPFEVEDDWFQVSVPSLILALTDRVPPNLVQKAERTIKAFGLRDGRDAISMRREWYEMHRLGQLTIGGLRQVAPLVAKAVDAWLMTEQTLPFIPNPRRPAIVA